MKSVDPLSALLLGTLVAGLAAAFAWWLAIIASAISFGSSGGLMDTLFLAFFLGCIGVVVGGLLAFPLLAALRAANLLTYISAAGTGAIIGAASMLPMWASTAFEPPYFILGAILGATCGCIALRVASAISMRPNTSLERTRER